MADTKVGGASPAPQPAPKQAPAPAPSDKPAPPKAENNPPAPSANNPKPPDSEPKPAEASTRPAQDRPAGNPPAPGPSINPFNFTMQPRPVADMTQGIAPGNQTGNKLSQTQKDMAAISVMDTNPSREKITNINSTFTSGGETDVALVSALTSNLNSQEIESYKTNLATNQSNTAMAATKIQSLHSRSGTQPGSPAPGSSTMFTNGNGVARFTLANVVNPGFGSIRNLG